MAASVLFTTIDTPIGPLVAAARDEGICLLEYSDPSRLDRQMQMMQRVFRSDLDRSGFSSQVDHPHIARLRDELAAYFAGRLRAFTVPLVAPGTPFQQRVWSELLRIPYGETCSYEDVAIRIGARDAQRAAPPHRARVRGGGPGSAARAVGAANGMNRIAIVIPCHRVVNKSGKLGGYGGQLWRKQALLELESTGQMSLRYGDGGDGGNGNGGD